MKIAISSNGNSLESMLDERFGRCAYFVVYDTESKAMEFIPNPNKDVEEGAGTASVHLVASRNVSKIIAGEFGMKIKSLMDSLKIQMIIPGDADLQIKTIIEILKQSK